LTQMTQQYSFIELKNVVAEISISISIATNVETYHSVLMAP